MSKNQKLSGGLEQASEANETAGSLSFCLVSGNQGIVANGIRDALPQGPAATLASRSERFFAQLTDGPRAVVGAMPFDRRADDYLFQPETIDFDAEKAIDGRTAGRRRPQANRWLVQPEPSAAVYSDAVRACLGRMAIDETLRKVVLSRSLLVAADGAMDVDGLLADLAQDHSVTTFLTRLPDMEGGARLLVGATPELLVSKAGGQVVSHPLAGSARRQPDPAADRSAAAALERSEKDRREHRAVVEAVLDTLSPYCSALATPETETLTATATMWHLGTRIVGRLKDARTPVVELAAALHPTPAVCGLPREAAAETIQGLEAYDRGFYAGAVGWSDEHGDGTWYVSLRCAEIAGSRARLYAGAGIVLGSDPLAEADETSAKFLAMLRALGVDEQGRPLGERAA